MRLLGLIKIKTLRVVYFYRPSSRCKGDERRLEGLRERNVKRRPSEALVKALWSLAASGTAGTFFAISTESFLREWQGLNFCCRTKEGEVKLTWPTLQQLRNSTLISLVVSTFLRRGSQTVPEGSGAEQSTVRRELRSCKAITGYNFTRGPEPSFCFSLLSRNRDCHVQRAGFLRPPQFWCETTALSVLSSSILFPVLKFQTFT